MFAFVIISIGLIAILIIVLVQSIQEKNRKKRELEEQEAERQRQQREKRERNQIEETVYDVVSNIKDMSQLYELPQALRETPFYIKTLTTAVETALNYYMYQLLHYEIDYRYFAGIILWVSQCVELESRFKPLTARLKDILSGRSCFTQDKSYHETIDEFGRAFDEKISQIAGNVVKLRKTIASLPQYKNETDYKEELVDRTIGGVAETYWSGARLDSALQVLTDTYDENTKTIQFIPACMIYLATVRERTEQIMDIEQNVHFLYEIFYQPRTESDELKQKGILVRETKDLLIAKSLIYMRSGLPEKVDSELNQYLYEIQNEDMIDDIQEQFLMLQKFFQEYGMKKQEEMILVAMLDRGMVLSSELEIRLQYLHKGLNNSINIFNEESEDEFIYDYRAANWNRQEFSQYMDELTMARQVLNMPLVIDKWEKNINAQGVAWDIGYIQENVSLLLEQNFGDDFVCCNMRARAAAEMKTESEDSLLIREEEGKYSWLGFLITGEQITKRQVAVAIYVLFLPKMLPSEGIKKEEQNSQIFNWIISIKEKQNPKVNNMIQTMQTLLIENLEKCINREMDDNIYG